MKKDIPLGKTDVSATAEHDLLAAIGGRRGGGAKHRIGPKGSLLDIFGGRGR